MPIVHAQDAVIAGDRFFNTKITRNDGPLLAQALFNDTEGNTIVMGAPLIAVISKAYGLPDYRIVDGPEWIYTPHLYDIEAVPPPAFIDSSETVMLQNLLKDQFEFEATMATREISTLALELDGDSLNLESITASAYTGFAMRLGKPPDSNMSATFTLDGLALAASRALKQPVTNLTGLQGMYRIEVDLSSKIMSIPIGNIDPADIFKLVIEASGLSTEQKLLPMDVLVVKKIAHPELPN